MAKKRKKTLIIIGMAFFIPLTITGTVYFALSNIKANDETKLDTILNLDDNQNLNFNKISNQNLEIANLISETKLNEMIQDLLNSYYKNNEVEFKLIRNDYENLSLKVQAQYKKVKKDFNILYSVKPLNSYFSEVDFSNLGETVDWEIKNDILNLVKEKMIDTNYSNDLKQLLVEDYIIDQEQIKENEDLFSSGLKIVSEQNVNLGEILFNFQTKNYGKNPGGLDDNSENKLAIKTFAKTMIEVKEDWVLAGTDDGRVLLLDLSKSISKSLVSEIKILNDNNYGHVNTILVTNKNTVLVGTDQGKILSLEIDWNFDQPKLAINNINISSELKIGGAVQSMFQDEQGVIYANGTKTHSNESSENNTLISFVETSSNQFELLSNYEINQMNRLSSVIQIESNHYFAVDWNAAGYIFEAKNGKYENVTKVIQNAGSFSFTSKPYANSIQKIKYQYDDNRSTFYIFGWEHGNPNGYNNEQISKIAFNKQNDSYKLTKSQGNIFNHSELSFQTVLQLKNNLTIGGTADGNIVKVNTYLDN